MTAGFLVQPQRSPLWATLWMSLGLLPLLWWLLGPSGLEVQVVSKTWRLELEIEKLIDEAESNWCDEMPAQARNITRRRVLDPAAGRSAAAEHCRYNVPQWRALRMVLAEGAAPALPVWPQAALNSIDADQLGAERLGKRRAFYEIQLRSPSGQAWVCNLPLGRWQSLRAGAMLRLPVDRYGVANCGAVAAG